MEEKHDKRQHETLQAVIRLLLKGAHIFCQYEFSVQRLLNHGKFAVLLLWLLLNLKPENHRLIFVLL